MRKQDWSKFIVVLLLLLTFPGRTLADTGPEGFKQEIDGYQVELVFTTEQPQIGSNELAIKLHDSHGQPLNDAIVEVRVIRPDLALPNEAPVDNHNQTQVNNHVEAGVADHHEADTGGHTTLDEANHSEAGAGPHEDAIAHESNSDNHGENDSSDSHEAEVGDHQGEAENKVTQLVSSSTAGYYTGQIDFMDTGKWLISVNFMVAGEAKEANFVVETTRNTTTWFVISSFLGANVVVIVAAAFLKSKSVHTKRGVK